jgi:protein involved in polysaccharide export with SLBB domain
MMNLLWKTLSWGGAAVGLLLAGVTLTGCYSSSSLDSIFSENPMSPVTAGPSTGPSTGSSTGSPTTAYSTTEVARFHVGDTVMVTLTGPPEVIEPHSEPIKEDGTITMPNIGHVQAVGKTAGELQNTIHDLYVPKYYRRLNVTVNTGDRVYFVTGEVKGPGRQLYAGQMTVTKAITTAGGFTDFANHGKVWLLRAGGERIKVNCDKAFMDPSQDPLVYPNDQIQVPRKLW